ncbi:Mo-dependent nitrogenase [Pleurocapsa sp. CCALA 161]|uniref:Mo-dependent nitrogenase C-terminal domain-containing protein n=1 Tax=Pleurocapsa sp. CCALA 161 TaxID=2107688 RepID=UPI000D04F8B5|nr:Mo-dependent nitrogenase C-terminal domain-containing protein [Pleurocapsa sp. CCALA 161]PSB12524.1 Mo-dependent nitrogenase [Pleurocapsa sp. CCALA 161]
MTTLIQKRQQKTFKLVLFLQQWLNNLEIKQEQTARRIVRLIPAQCPFAREIRAFDRVIVKIPALCKFNPLYEELIGLRFRALCFLADECGEDITPYCSY